MPFSFQPRFYFDVIIHHGRSGEVSLSLQVGKIVPDVAENVLNPYAELSFTMI
jgi:hypothetical protein